MIDTYIENNYESMRKLLKDLCLIPAPSHYEENRAEFCKKWFEDIGAKGAYIDEAKNVIFPINCDGSDEITVFAAHTDTVFPDTEPMPYREEDGKVYSPGVGDDTASVVVLMHCAKYFVENDIRPEKGIMFVCNSCEEGLGNLKGTKQLMDDFSGRVKQFVTFDASIGAIYPDCVGSHRYEVETRCEGGHSLYGFGKENAIRALSEIITDLYKIKVPERDGKKTTYNVGVIEGGTSVNTIAQNAKMLCEYRSDSAECLDIMKREFARVFNAAKNNETEVIVTKIGERPCSRVDAQKQNKLVSTCKKITESVTGESADLRTASTDCNIPLSLGVPAVCIGVCVCEGTHTREEYIEAESLKTGLDIGLKTVCELTL